MAETQNTKQDDQKTNPGTPSPESTDTADTAVARSAGISEGEVKALRDEAGVNQSAGHQSDIHAWSLTEAGKQFKKDEKDRNKAEAEVAKERKAALNKDGLNEAEAKYAEAVKKS